MAAVAVDLPLVLFLGVTLLVRVLTDNLSSPDSRQSGSLNLSGVIAVLLIGVAFGLLLRRRRGMLPTALAVLWLCVWTGVAVSTSGASTETIREGVREVSVVALAVIVYNARGVITVSIAARLVQVLGFVPALIAVYQIATNTGANLAGELRAYGTFAHPDSAAMFFALAATASLWLYLESGRRRSDALLLTLFAAALVMTVSIDGLVTLVAMLIALGAVRPGSVRVKLGPCGIAALVVLVFFATPLGSQRITGESSTNLSASELGGSNTSLDWRLHKWKALLPKWESSPLIGRGLGTTTIEGSILGNRYAGKPPHNEYVRYLVETGVIGLDSGSLDTSTLAIVVVIGCLVDSLADNTLLNSPTCYAAVLIVIAALRVPRIDTHRVSVPRAL
jgi:O-antigen ligase